MGDFRDLEVVPCEKPFSFFQEAHQYEGSSYNAALHRVFSLARKLCARTLIREELSRDEWLDAHDEAQSARLGAAVRTRLRKISFFDRRFLSVRSLESLPQSAFIGYATVACIASGKVPREAYVHDSVMRSPQLLNNYVHCERSFEQTIGGVAFPVQGSYFSQQNHVTGCCVHAALRNALVNLAAVDQGDLADEKINERLGLSAAEASKGLNDKHAVGVIEAAKLAAHPFDFLRHPELEYTYFAHPYLESGYPVLLSFQGAKADDQGHMVAAVGHTLNTDVWYPEVKLGYFRTDPVTPYLTASHWVPHLIVHDDNYGMYSCLSASCLLKRTSAKKDPTCRVKYAIGICPPGLSMRPYIADHVAKFMLVDALKRLKPRQQQLRWLKELKRVLFDQRRAPVFRTMFISKWEYIDHLAESEDWDRARLRAEFVAPLQERLPELFWMVEVSIPEIYTANKSKLGEMLVDVRDPLPRLDNGLDQCWLGGRLPGVLFLPPLGPGRAPEPVSIPPEAHVPLYRLPHLRWTSTEW